MINNHNLHSMQVVEHTRTAVCLGHNTHFVQLQQPLHLLKTVKYNFDYYSIIVI